MRYSIGALLHAVITSLIITFVIGIPASSSIVASDSSIVEQLLEIEYQPLIVSVMRFGFWFAFVIFVVLMPADFFIKRSKLAPKIYQICYLVSAILIALAPWVLIACMHYIDTSPDYDGLISEYTISTKHWIRATFISLFVIWVYIAVRGAIKDVSESCYGKENECKNTTKLAATAENREQKREKRKVAQMLIFSICTVCVIVILLNYTHEPKTIIVNSGGRDQHYVNEICKLAPLEEVVYIKESLESARHQIKWSWIYDSFLSGCKASDVLLAIEAISILDNIAITQEIYENFLTFTQGEDVLYITKLTEHTDELIDMEWVFNVVAKGYTNDEIVRTLKFLTDYSDFSYIDEDACLYILQYNPTLSDFHQIIKAQKEATIHKYIPWSEIIERTKLGQTVNDIIKAMNE